ncbi:class I SAM-dependent methyltransferase [Thermococcus alcaliphilus]|uniref:class I SAM-dependent methyltransferase n=1 Tax=Thermococcus alcaliphilus TaxID=139207 RepID=UPI0020912AC4|nr:class I SAM-dependent methyltransferase [Thermococcus alcaliphilus]MCO6040540.1 class I SAM-dependent methyltransferase [Thermococcus alcaliphilus]
MKSVDMMIEKIIDELHNLGISNIEHIIPSVHFYLSAILISTEKNKKNQKPLKVLDIGCSKGYGIYIMKKLCPECKFIGIDIDEYSVSVSNTMLSNLNNATCVVGDIIDEDTVKSIYLEHGLFDIITCFEVYEHIPSQSAKKLLKHIKFLLKSEGLLFISTPNKRIYDIDAYTADHINEVFPQEFIRELELAGFSVLNIFGLYTQNPTLIQMLEKLNLGARIGDRKNDLSFSKKLLRYIIVSLLSPDRVYSSILKKVSYKKYLEFKAKKARLTGDYLNSSLIFVVAKNTAKT